MWDQVFGEVAEYLLHLQHFSMVNTVSRNDFLHQRRYPFNLRTGGGMMRLFDVIDELLLAKLCIIPCPRFRSQALDPCDDLLSIDGLGRTRVCQCLTAATTVIDAQFLKHSRCL